LACAILAILGMVPNVARAQLYAGSLSGVVSDPTGALVVNAAVTLTDVGKGFVHTARTNATGVYSFTSLAPTVYKLSVTAKGFATDVIPAITVNVNESATANITLKLGQSTETITVQTSSPVGLNTEDASNGQVVDHTLITSLPLINRAVLDLSALAPGVSPPEGSVFNPGSVGNNFVSEGSRNSQAEILIDGIGTTNYEQNTGWIKPLYTPSVDDVQEFKVQQSNFSAEFGFSGATIINVVTLSGSNTWHGSAYEYLRNTIFNSENWFAKQAGQSKSPYHWNDFGGKFSGPLKRDKIFFFVDYEGSRQITPQINNMDLPTDLERSGDFGQVCTLGAGGSFNGAGQCVAPGSNGPGDLGQVWDPFTSGSKGYHYDTAFVPYNNMATYASHGSCLGCSANLPSGNAVAAGNLINPVAQKILQFLPHATNQNALHANYLASGGNVNNWNQYDVKVDSQITPNDNLSARWSTGWGPSLAANLFGNVFDNNTQGPVSSLVYEGSANYTHTFSANTLLTVTAGATHHWAQTMGDPVPPATWTSLGLPPSLETNPSHNVQQAPLISIGGYAVENNGQGGGGFGAQGWDVMLYGEDVGNVAANISHTMRNHELKAGVESHLHRINFTQWGLPNGSYSYQSAATAGDWSQNYSTGGDGWASYMTGWATGWSAITVPPSPATQNFQYAGFVQDNWKVNHKLTINAGFRYDLDMPRTERHNRMDSFDITKPSPIASQVTGVDPLVCPACDNLRGLFSYTGGTGSKYAYNIYRGAIGPRLGFAWAVKPTTTIRGGVGIYYDPGKTGAAGVGSGAAGFQNYATQTTWSDDNNTNNRAYYQTIIGQSVTATLPVGNKYGTDTQLGSDLQGIPVRTFNALPREYTWSLGVQHEFASKLLVDVNYIGKHAQHLYMGGFINYLNHINAAAATVYANNCTPYQAASCSNENSANTAVPTALSTAIGNAVVPLEGAWQEPLGPTTTGGGSWYPWNAFLPYPQYADGPWGTGNLQNVDPPIAKSNYHGLTVAVSRPMLKGLQFLGNYTAQASYDNGSSQGSNEYILGSNLNGVQNPNNIGAEYSHSAFDMPQMAQGTFVYQIPFGKGRLWSTGRGKLDTILGDWQTSGGYQWNSGQLLSFPMGSGGQHMAPGYSSRPNLSAPLKKNPGNQGVMVNGAIRGAGYFANNNAISQPADFQDGNAPRVLPSVTAPGTNNFNLAVDKNFAIKYRKDMTLKFRWETYNLFNHVQYSAPNMSPSYQVVGGIATTAFPTTLAHTFGTITSQANSPMIQQVSLRLDF
jgi:hypothetical protein